MIYTNDPLSIQLVPLITYTNYPPLWLYVAN